MKLKHDKTTLGILGYRNGSSLCTTYWLHSLIGTLRSKTAMILSLVMLGCSIRVHAQITSSKVSSAKGPLVSGKINPALQTIGYNTFPAILTSTSPTGGNGIYSYQWQSSANGGTWVNLSGANALTYAPRALTATTYYRLISVSNGSRVTSATVVVNVKSKD